MHQDQNNCFDFSSRPITQVLVCQNITCSKQGAAKVLEAFRVTGIPAITMLGSGCLGQCGNGPMVLVLPEQIWYSHIDPHDVSLIVTQHLLQGSPVTAIQFHPTHR